MAKPDVELEPGLEQATTVMATTRTRPSNVPGKPLGWIDVRPAPSHLGRSPSDRNGQGVTMIVPVIPGSMVQLYGYVPTAVKVWLNVDHGGWGLSNG
jgi:hypothetical protein